MLAAAVTGHWQVGVVDDRLMIRTEFRLNIAAQLTYGPGRPGTQLLPSQRVVVNSLDPTRAAELRVVGGLQNSLLLMSLTMFRPPRKSLPVFGKVKVYRASP